MVGAEYAVCTLTRELPPVALCWVRRSATVETLHQLANLAVHLSSPIAAAFEKCIDCREVTPHVKQLFRNASQTQAQTVHFQQ